MKTVFLRKRPEPCPICGRRRQSVRAYRGGNDRKGGYKTASMRARLAQHETTLADQS